MAQLYYGEYKTVSDVQLIWMSQQLINTYLLDQESTMKGTVKQLVIMWPEKQNDANISALKIRSYRDTTGQLLLLIPILSTALEIFLERQL